ncbi:hypothetical protein CGC20_37225 [Leishmania donovani]|uniref:Uncharacterized protein n=1 Tax=Leishmania donovani TaxID=5661 RepID=A0A504X6Q6_LEIDO|nr:hypothetical protein CGC20_37225 [Leishmania donovani]
MILRRLRDHLEAKLQPPQPGLRPHRSTAASLDLYPSPSKATPASYEARGSVGTLYARALDAADRGAVIPAPRKLSMAAPYGGDGDGLVQQGEADKLATSAVKEGPAPTARIADLGTVLRRELARPQETIFTQSRTDTCPCILDRCSGGWLAVTTWGADGVLPITPPAFCTTDTIASSLGQHLERVPRWIKTWSPSKCVWRRRCPKEWTRKNESMRHIDPARRLDGMSWSARMSLHLNGRQLS